MRPWSEVYKELSPELRLALLCSNLETRDANHDEIEKLITSEINWPDFIHLVLRHRVYPLVYRYLRTLAHPIVPNEILANLSRFDKDNIYKTLQMVTEFLKLLKSLDEGGIRAVPIKGFFLAHQLYGDITLRTSRDLDILVHPEDVDEARKIIESRGYVCKHTLGSARPLKKWIESNKHLEYLNPHLEIFVELHWRLECQGMGLPQYLIETSMTSVQMLGQLINVLDRELLLLYLVIHGAAHSWFRLKWLLDIDILIRKGEFSWEKLYQLANSLQLRPVFNQALILVRTLFDTPLPKGVTDLVKKDMRAQYLATMALQLITDIDNQPNNTKPLREKLRLFYRQKLYEFSLIGLQNKLSFILSSFFLPSVEDLELLSLSEKLYFIYYAIAPFTWFYRSTRKVMKIVFQGCEDRTVQ